MITCDGASCQVKALFSRWFVNSETKESRSIWIIQTCYAAQHS
jgi:hypothetical protein